ncbi:permease [Mariniblastus sp.]|nr:permease [Mariniblastus sp.]
MISASWQILCELAPWLLLGMLLSGLLHAFLPSEFIRREFRGVAGTIKAVLLGVPLPLCSCGVVPAGIGLKNQGASDGAAVGFLISTPQTGIDSILVSASFFGWPFAIFKMVVAAITGVAGGLLADLPSGTDTQLTNEFTPSAGKADETDQSKVALVYSADQPWWQKVWEHGFEILQSIWIWLIVGVILSAVISVWVPPSWLASISGLGIFPAMLLMLAISIPMYVCATASVPIAAALVQGGLDPATALVFLMAGPATNVATIGAIRSRFGNRTTVTYVLTLVVGSMLGAWLFSELLSADVTDQPIHLHHHVNWFSQLSAVILTLMIGWCAWNQFGRRTFSGSSAINADGPTVQIGVDGMHCQSCVMRLEKALNQHPGVEMAHADLASEIVTFQGSVQPSDLHQTIHDAGFSVRND